MKNEEFRKKQAEDFNKKSDPVERSAQQRAIDGLGKMASVELDPKILAHKAKMEELHIADKDLMYYINQLNAYSRGEGPAPEYSVNDKYSSSTIKFVREHIRNKRPGKYVTDDGDREETGI